METWTGRYAVIAAVLLCGAAGCGSGTDLLDADLLTVGSSASADFSSIVAAVGSAKAGATIVVEPGTYTEHVEIEKPITLTGAGAGTVVESPVGADPSDPVIEIRGTGDVRVESLSVRAAGDGIGVRNSSDVVIAAVIASDNGDEGIDVRNSQDVQIQGTFEGNAGQGIQVREGSMRVLIHSSIVSGNLEDGVRVEFSSDVTLESSTILGNTQDGIKIESAANCTVRGSDVANNGDDGILVGESTGVQLIENSVVDNLGNGIHLRGSPDTLLEGNSVSGNAGGNIDID